MSGLDRLRQVILPVAVALALGATAAPCRAVTGATPVFSGAPHDNLYALSFEGQNGVAVGDFGLIVDTSDGGKTWHRQDAPPTALALLAVTRKDGRCIAVGQSGAALFSSDCKRWSVSPALSGARLFAVSVASDGTAYAVGSFGTIQKSTDWGRTWQALAPDWKALLPGGAEPHLYGVHVADNGEVTIVGEFELVIRSRDAGRNWSVLRSGRRSLFAVFVADDGCIHAVGQEGVLLRGSADGTQWAEIHTGTTAVLTSVWAGKNRIFVAGIYTILHSDDAGRSWMRDTSRIALSGIHHALAAVPSAGGPRALVSVGSGAMVLVVER